MNAAQVPGLLRRLAAMSYDLILVFGLLLVGVALVVLPYSAFSGQPFPRSGWMHHLFQLYLLSMLSGFYLYFWTHGGQTLGMRAWRLRLVREDGQPLTWADGSKRLFWACLTLAPLGLLPMVWDAQGRGLYDRLSRTKMVLLSATDTTPLAHRTQTAGAAAPPPTKRSCHRVGPDR